MAAAGIPAVDREEDGDERIDPSSLFSGSLPCCRRPGAACQAAGLSLGLGGGGDALSHRLQDEAKATPIGARRADLSLPFQNDDSAAKPQPLRPPTYGISLV